MSDSNTNRIVTIPLKGRIDSNNVSSVEAGILAALRGKEGCVPIFEASALEYISSAGLRLLLRLRQEYHGLSVINVRPEVYEIFDMTGFTEMMHIEKAYRSVSVEGCEQIGSGANGAVYRLDAENVVKVYNDTEALEQIRHEREMAKLALVLGLPTAISYDVVRVGDSYGSVFELLNALPMSRVLAEQPDKFDMCVKEFASLLNKIHSTAAPEDRLPKIKDSALEWANQMQPHLPPEDGAKLLRLVNEVPDDPHLVHGDFHPKNLLLQNGEVLLIDMDTLSTGHPIFELSPIFNALVGFHEYDHEGIKAFQGFDFETGRRFFRAVLADYLGTSCQTKLCEVADKARIIGYSRLITRSVRHGGLETDNGRAEIDFWKTRLIKLLHQYDTLCFSKDELMIEALRENLPEVLRFIEDRTASIEPSEKAKMQLGVAVEEIFVNIADYAYIPDTGSVLARVVVAPEARSVTITFEDSGCPFDPLLKQAPDLSLPAEKRTPGGLGIFLAKKLTDEIGYEYKDGKNILTILKKM